MTATGVRVDLDTPALNNIINKDIFKAYDIPGQIETEWRLKDAYLIGHAIGNNQIPSF